MHFITYIAAAILIAGWVVFSVYQSRRGSKSKSTEVLSLPGPKQLPFIGRVHDLPVKHMWLKFAEWADIYGPIYYTSMFGTEFVVVSDESIAEELLVKRAKYNSDRPMMRSVTDSKSSEGGMEYLPLMGKNKYWARQRRFVHSYLMEAANAQYHGAMYHETRRWLFRLLENPDDFAFSLEDMASKVMCQLTWDDPSVSEYYSKSAWALLTQMSPAGPITNLITPLWHLPHAINPWKKAEKVRHDEQSGWWMNKFLYTRALHKNGLVRQCWTRQYLEIEKNAPLSGDKEASAALGMVALVGIFTVAGPLYYFLLSMVHHPEWQAKCQKEIDEACQGAMPTLDDSSKLPILRACIKETMRWRPNVPTGVAHETEQDDYFRGQFIPKGARILPLDWAFLRNPAKYPDPENFRPERWLEPNWPTYKSPLTMYPMVKGMSSFGFGQRACLGQTLTQDELLVACGGLLWGYNLKKKIDPVTGVEVDISLTASNSLLIIKPDPFQMAFHPRSQTRKAEIIQNWQLADDMDTKDRQAFAKAAALERATVL
jgi:cytochrome P450